MIEFTEQQKIIFDFISKGTGNGMINAVAGAGKTTTLLEAARYIDTSEDVLFCAFNKSVAMEIEQRARLNGLKNVHVRTIHALGWNIINSMRFNTNTVADKYRSIISSQGPMVEEYLNKVLEAANVNSLQEVLYFDQNPAALISKTIAQRDKFYIAKRICNAFPNILLQCVDRIRQTLTENNESKFRIMVNHYRIFKDLETRIPNLNKVIEIIREISFKIVDIGIQIAEHTHQIDFNDMLYLPYIWDLKPESKFNYCFVDECQDLARGQVEIIKKCISSDARILAVGDPSQSICGYTGADTKSYNTIKRIFSAKEFQLSGSFRCAKKIIEEAQSIRPAITGVRKEEGHVSHITFDEALKEAKTGDMVVSRSRDTLIRFALKLIESNVPIRLHANECPKVLSEIRGLFSPYDIKADFTLRGDRILYEAKLRGFSDAERRYRKVFDEDIKAELIGNYRSKVEMYINYISKNWNKWGGNSLYMFFFRLEEKLSGQLDKEYVRIFSVHLAKGLEENRVFILDYDDLPAIQDNQRVWEKEQEKNLKYVAITRSKNDLYLVSPLPKVIWRQQLTLF